MKKWFLWLFALLAAVVVLPCTAQAAEYMGYCGYPTRSSVTWTLDTDTKTLTISGTGMMEMFGGFTSAPWHDRWADIQYVEVTEGITHLGSHSFQQLPLVSVTLPDTLTYIGSDAFNFCELRSITIPNSVTYIGDRAFYSNKKLTSLTIPGSVTQLGEMVCAASGLTTVTVSRGVKTLPASAFSNCTALTTVNLPDTLTYLHRVKCLW